MIPGEVTYFHIELIRHDVILAQGLLVEAYLDVGDRADFSGGPITNLRPEFAARWETSGYAPLVLTGDKLLAARRLLRRPARRGLLAL